MGTPSRRKLGAITLGESRAVNADAKGIGAVVATT